MRKAFIDCGGHCGCSRRYFRDKYDPKNEYEIFSFEPDPVLCQRNPELIQKAVWIEDGEMTFHRFEERGGSSLNEHRADKLEQQTGKYGGLGNSLKPYSEIRQSVTVETIDLNRYILENFNKEDYIVLKLDIECAEYQVIPHMMDGAMRYVNKLYLEWHDPNKCGCGVGQKERLTKSLIKMGVEVGLWDAMLKDYCIVRGWKP